MDSKTDSSMDLNWMRPKTVQWLKIAFVSGLASLLILSVLLVIRCFTKQSCPDPSIAGTKRDKTVKIGFFDNLVSLIQVKTGVGKQ